MKKILFLSALLLASNAPQNCDAKGFFSAAKTHLSSQDGWYYGKASIGVVGVCVCVYQTCRGVSYLYDRHRSKGSVEKVREKVSEVVMKESKWEDYFWDIFLFAISAIITIKMGVETVQECSTIWSNSSHSRGTSPNLFTQNNGQNNDEEEGNNMSSLHPIPLPSNVRGNLHRRPSIDELLQERLNEVKDGNSGGSSSLLSSPQPPPNQAPNVQQNQVQLQQAQSSQSLQPQLNQTQVQQAQPQAVDQSRLNEVAHAVQNGKDPCIYCARKGYLDVLKYYVEERGADFNIQNEYGNTALIKACYRGREQMARYLLGQRADINMQASDGNTALTWACLKGHEQLAMYLVSRGADYNHRNSEGKNAQEIAQENGFQLLQAVGAQSIQGQANNNYNG